MKRAHRRHHRRGAVELAVGALSIGLIGTGVQAAFAEGRGGDKIQSGTLACRLSSTDPRAVISSAGHTVTVKMPAIVTSMAGSDLSNVSVVNSGSVPMIVQWTEQTSGTIMWQPHGSMRYLIGTANNRLSADITLAPGARHSYDGLGFQWASLTNADLGKTATVTYTAQCSPVGHEDERSDPHRRDSGRR